MSRRCSANASAQMTTIGVNGDFFHWQGGWPSGLLIRGGVVEHQPCSNELPSASTRRHAARRSRRLVHTLARAERVTYPLAALNGPVWKNSATLFTPVWGGNTPTVNGAVVVLSPFPPRRGAATSPGRSPPSRPAAACPSPQTVRCSLRVARPRRTCCARQSSASRSRCGSRFGRWATVTDAVSAGPTLIKDGRPLYNAGEALTPIQLRGRDPRTAIGQRPDGGIVLIAVDGRRPGWSIALRTGTSR